MSGFAGSDAILLGLTSALAAVGGWFLARHGERIRRRARDVYHVEAARVAGRARDRAREEARLLHERLARLQEEHDLCARRIQELEAELGEREERLERREAALAEAKRAHARLLEEARSARARSERREPARGRGNGSGNGAPAWLLSAPEGAKDDLQAIRGLGPVLEHGLNKLGVFHYRQLARMTAQEREWIASHVNVFPGRIARDDWASQAREMHFRKYHERL